MFAPAEQWDSLGALLCVNTEQLLLLVSSLSRRGCCLCYFFNVFVCFGGDLPQVTVIQLDGAGTISMRSS